MDWTRSTLFILFLFFYVFSEETYATGLRGSLFQGRISDEDRRCVALREWRRDQCVSRCAAAEWAHNVGQAQAQAQTVSATSIALFFREARCVPCIGPPVFLFSFSHENVLLSELPPGTSRFLVAGRYQRPAMSGLLRASSRSSGGRPGLRR